MSKNIKIGDTVYLKPGTLPIKRIGYPLHYSEIEEMDDPFLEDIFNQINKHKFKKSRSKEDIKTALTKAYVSEKDFGGRERTVHRYSLNDLTPPNYDLAYIVESSKRKVLGKYVPSSSGSGFYHTEPESAYLEDQQHIRVLTIYSKASNSFYNGIPFEVLDTDCGKWGLPI